jgi:hypothetical protein
MTEKMKGLHMKRKITALGMVFWTLVLAACASVVNTESRIEERATARWGNLLSGDLAGAYQYLSPGVRSSVSSLDYQRSILSQQLQWTSAEYIESDCEDKTCNVKILLGFRVFGALPGVKSFEDTDIVDESWILVDDEWYFVPRR